MNKIANLYDIKIHAVSLNEALEIVIEHIAVRNGNYFCFLDTHVMAESRRDPDLRKALLGATGNFPDGAIVAWTLKLMGYRFKYRVYGTDFMIKICENTAGIGSKIFLYGNTQTTLDLLEDKLKEKFPAIKVVGKIAPPFRELTDSEDALIVEEINESGADILFVSLGGIKQEKWMHKHKGKIRPIQLGVGAAFNFLAGNLKQAPLWMQRSGLQWLYRLPQQPKKTFPRILLIFSFIGNMLGDFIKRKIKK